MHAGYEMKKGTPGETGGGVGPCSGRRARVPTSPKRLLVVDDEAVIRDLLRKSLESQRYIVDLAEDGEEAWLRIQATTYDCILLDLKMPGKSGGELYQRLEASDKQVAKKVIFITGNAPSLDSRDFISDSGTPVLHKPFHLDELHRQILMSLELSAQLPR